MEQVNSIYGEARVPNAAARLGPSPAAAVSSVEPSVPLQRLKSLMSYDSSSYATRSSTCDSPSAFHDSLPAFQTDRSASPGSNNLAVQDVVSPTRASISAWARATISGSPWETTSSNFVHSSVGSDGSRGGFEGTGTRSPEVSEGSSGRSMVHVQSYSSSSHPHVPDNHSQSSLDSVPLLSVSERPEQRRSHRHHSTRRRHRHTRTAQLLVVPQDGAVANVEASPLRCLENIDVLEEISHMIRQSRLPLISLHYSPGLNPSELAGGYKGDDVLEDSYRMIRRSRLI
ncbi:hypothetical protein A0H81_12981 [Grifola frondosa]|uniref:Uncharacterized protein n=1 Tax=Grifola frondosa TaxID=5627 RepID=A0A1C7LQN7_GRIFR|nr:hypothetical protein A0H81_12981 [Grifola frondosa]